MINETLKLKINNLHFHFHKFGGLYIEEHDILIISDLHFGKGISFLKWDIRFLHSTLMILYIS